MSLDPVGARSAPRFETAVRRRGIERAVNTDLAEVVLFVAPSGFGKSVAAAQVARSDWYDTSIWVDCSLIDPSEPHTLLHETLVAIGWDCPSPTPVTNPLLPDNPQRDVDKVLREALRAFVDTRLCLVLDGLPEGLPMRSLLALTSHLRTVPDCVFTVIGTTRSCDTVDSDLGQASVLGPEFLRMSDLESRQLVAAIAGEMPDEDTIQRIIDVSGGQAALVCLLGRHTAAGRIQDVLAGKLTVDLDALLYASANTQLTQDDRDVLFATSLLRQGSTMDLHAVLENGQEHLLGRVAERVPLVHSENGDGRATFCVHDLAATAFSRPTWAASHVPDWERILHDVLARLDATNRYDRLFETALAAGVKSTTLGDWAVRRGSALLDSGQLALLGAVLDALGPMVSIQRPELLLLQARVLREQQCYEQALRKSQVAYRLATHDDGAPLENEALLLNARLQLDLGLIGDAARSLEAYMRVASCDAAADSSVLAQAYLAACRSYVGDYGAAASHMRSATSALASVESAEVRARVAICSAATDGLVGGRWDVVLEQFQVLADDSALSLGTRLQVRGNLGTVLCEMGRTERAGELLAQTLEECRESGFKMLERAFLGSMAAVEASRGNYAAASDMVDSAMLGHEEAGDMLELGHTLAYHSAWLRAQGLVERSLLKAERVLEAGAVSECEWLQWIGLLELGAGYLAEGDLPGARRQAVAVLTEARAAGAQFHALCAELLLAELDRRDGDLSSALSRILPHRDYILTGSANWQLCMYIRAFPGLLGLLSLAIDPFDFPVQLLRSLAAVEPQRLLAACRDELSPSAWHALSTRMQGDGSGLSGAARQCRCTVSLFGETFVGTTHGSIGAGDWKKSKARLLFLMLVLANGREIPREQILDYLWPEMDEVRARNNFYVVWSAMKLALMPGADKTTPCAYAVNSRGVCKLDTRFVQSDIARFEDLVARLHASSLPTERLSLCEELAIVYQGELLPGDIYEDWFARARERYRVDFADAMLQASSLLHQRGEIPRALMMARRGLAEDPLREDLGQAALQLQIASGQRSAAIDTFMSIKRRLCDDLGIDPSAETVRLYEQVLSMEEMGEYLPDGDDAGEPETAL